MNVVRITTAAVMLAAAWGLIADAEAAPKKAGPAPTAVEQATIDRVMAAQPDANCQLARNTYCPITGKPVDPSVPPIDCPQKFQHIHILVGVASAEAAEAYEAARAVNKSNKWAVPGPVTAAAANHMVVDLSNPRDPVLKPLMLPPELMAPVPAPKDVTVEIAVDASRRFQTIDGFGTATYAYNKPTHQIYAKPEFRKLIVEDLGLSMIRFELAPNHFKPVDKPEQISRQDFLFEGNPPGIPINEKTGRPFYGPVGGVVPCLEFIAALKKLDPTIRVTPSVWSPPGWMKDSQRTAGGGHLKPEFYPHFARYLVEWVRYVKEQYGIDLYALSPQNELEFSEPYASCQYTPEEYRDVVKTIGRVFREEKLGVKLFGPEDMTKYGKRTTRFVEIIEADAEARPFLDIIATHGYSDGVQLTGSVGENEDFWKLIKDYGKPYWQTETGTGCADDRWNDGGPDGKTESVAKDGTRLPVQGALSSVGGRLHYALAYGNASAWLFWQITGPNPSVHNLMVGDQPGKKYYVAKHFYRWIRPGAVRIAAGPDGGDTGVCVTAYQHAQDKTVTVVLLNRSHDNAKVTMSLKTDVPVAALETYRTSETEDCVALAGTAVRDGKVELILPPRCIVTLYGK